MPRTSTNRITDGSPLAGALALFRSAHPRRELVVHGLPWRYHVAGSGARTLLLLGGALGRAEFAFQQIHLLESYFRVLAPDYPPAQSMSQLTQGLLAILDAEGVQQAHVVGGSFGGLIAQALVRAAPDRVASLVLSHTGAPDGRRRGARLVSLLPPPLLRAALRARLGRTVAAADPFWRVFFRHAVSELTRADILSRLRVQAEFARSTHSPADLADWPGRVLIIDSADDPLLSQRARARLRGLYPRAQLHEFRATGHAAAILRPEEYARVITEFVKAEKER